MSTLYFRHLSYPDGSPCLKSVKNVKDFYKHKKHCPMNKNTIIIKEKEKKLTPILKR